MDFQETLYCHCRGPDLGKRMKQCSRCLDWFHEHCELCIAQEEMHLILSLVCKNWSEIVNINFRDRVHIAWLDREFNANNWSAEIKRKYRVPFTV